MLRPGSLTPRPPGQPGGQPVRGIPPPKTITPAPPTNVAPNPRRRSTSGTCALQVPGSTTSSVPASGASSFTQLSSANLSQRPALLSVTRTSEALGSPVRDPALAPPTAPCCASTASCNQSSSTSAEPATKSNPACDSPGSGDNALAPPDLGNCPACPPETKPPEPSAPARQRETKPCWTSSRLRYQASCWVHSSTYLERTLFPSIQWSTQMVSSSSSQGSSTGRPSLRRIRTTARLCFSSHSH